MSHTTEITPGELREFGSTNTLSEQAVALLTQQKQTWEQLSEGFASLEDIKWREIEFDGFKIALQFNPGRIKSSTAKVDKKSISKRSSFLLKENLPPEQRGIEFQGSKKYLVLGNPYPIFPDHLTIPTVDQEPQAIADAFGDFLDLSQQLGHRFTAFYNGPKCGASAPDHLHFQAGTRNYMPLDKEFPGLKSKFAKTLKPGGEPSVYAVDDGLRRYFALEGKEQQPIEEIFGKLYEVLDRDFKDPDEAEPMLNVLSGYFDGQYRVLVFPRAKHRPSHFYAEGDEKLVLSPASVDLGGLCITPREEDFHSIKRKTLQEIFDEIIVSENEFEKLTSAFRENLQ